MQKEIWNEKTKKKKKKNKREALKDGIAKRKRNSKKTLFDFE
jgi:hypothetical protein